MESVHINTNSENIICDEQDHQRLIKISSCTLNQWAMDFEGNKKRIIESIKQFNLTVVDTK
jgi:hypothetical protein